MAVGVATAKDPGRVCLWNFYLLDAGRQVRCTNLTTLLYYALSRGTTNVSVSEVTVVGIPRMQVRVTGPTAEDGVPLTTSYTVTSSEFGRLPEEDKSAFAKRLEEFAERPLLWQVYAVMRGAK